MKRLFKKNLGALAVIFDFTAEFISTNHIDESTAFAVNLAIEELFTNIVKYGDESGEVVSIQLDTCGNELVVELVDFDANPFDVTKAGKVDVTKSIEERGVGGLGLHLVHNVMDEITYEYKNRNAYITLTKHLEDANV
jgi:anti-sigma regulatory factor (Ser/Thr protein kinase)